tara:strand:+ start:810 stop:1376 length:567 start_codon:yes stop_codon:yes gene_type:complete
MRSVLAPFADINCNNFQDDIHSFYHRKWHIKPKDLKKHFDEKKWDWANYFKFTFARNPWDRLVSSFNYGRKVIHRQDKYEISHSGYERYKKRENDFGLWLSNFPNKPVLNFLSDDCGILMVDFIGKTENLQEDFNIICDKVGIPHQQLPRKNTTQHKHYTEYYNDETKQIVAERFARDIEYFNYKFGE